MSRLDCTSYESYDMNMLNDITIYKKQCIPLHSDSNYNFTIIFRKFCCYRCSLSLAISESPSILEQLQLQVVAKRLYLRGTCGISFNLSHFQHVEIIAFQTCLQERLRHVSAS